jgi:U32 family peptidase
LKKSVKKIELLAPAGNMDKLRVALRYGADAVYLSDRFFGLRGKAGNFRFREMKEGVDFAHALGKKVYVAVNLFAYNRDFRRLGDYLKILHHEIKADAAIVADPGVIDLAREIVPEMELHLSTQANTLNLRACKFWKKQGISRIILARELSFDDISSLAESGVVDLEIFVHGSICIAYSGRCFISNYLSSYRDANRGLCTNSCRWNYQVKEREFVVEEQDRPGEYMRVEEDSKGSYLFNSKDLSLLARLDEILSSNLVSIKIEGRTKSISYLSAVTALYRQAIDAWYRSQGEYWDLLPTLQNELGHLGNRGYTEGLFKGHQRDQYNLDDERGEQVFGLAGLVREASEVGGSILKQVSVKTKLVPGGKIQVFRPDLAHCELEIKKILTLDGEEVERALPGDEVYLGGLEKVPSYSILRVPTPAKKDA